MAIPNKKLPEPSEEETGCLPTLARLFWMFGGGVTLIFCAVSIILHKATVVVYLIYVIVTIGLIAVRFIDIKYLKGEKMNGERASMNDWRRYSLLLLIFVGLSLIAAKILAALISF